MAFTRSTTNVDSDAPTHTFTAVLHRDKDNIGKGSKVAFQTDGDNCPRDLRPVMSWLAKQLDAGNIAFNEPAKGSDGKVLQFFLTCVPAATDDDTNVDW